MQSGGCRRNPELVLGRLLSLGLGVSPSPCRVHRRPRLPYCALGLGLRLLRDEEQVWLFFAAVIVGSPALFCWASRPICSSAIFSSLLCFSCCCSVTCSALRRGSRWNRPLAAVVLCSGLRAEAPCKSRPSSVADAAISSTPWPITAIAVRRSECLRRLRFPRSQVLSVLRSLSQWRRAIHLPRARDAADAGDGLVAGTRPGRPPSTPSRACTMSTAMPTSTFGIFPPRFGGWNWHVYRNVHGFTFRREARLRFARNVNAK